MRATKLRVLARTTATLLATAVAVSTIDASVAAPRSTSDGTDLRKAGAAKPHYGSSIYREGGENMQEAFKRVSGKYGGSLDAVRIFYPGLPGSWRSLNENLGNSKASVVVSFKADPAAVVAGKHDAAFRTWFDSAPTDRRTYWSYWHEPEDNAMNTRQYRAAWRHLRGLARKADNPKLKATLILMCWTLSPNSGRHWKTWYAGDKVIQVLGFDCYNVGRKNNVYTDPRNILRPVARLSRRVGKPFGIAEFGSTVIKEDGGTRGRARWLRQYGRVVKEKGGRFATVWDSAAKGTDFRIDDKPSISAWKDVVQNY